MGALPTSEVEFAEVVEVDGREMLRLPQGLHLKGKRFRVVESGNSIYLNPPRKVMSEEDWKQWSADMQRFQSELGDLLPEGRNQPSMPKDDAYAPGLFGESES